MSSENEDWLGEAALGAVRGLRDEEKKRLSARLASVRDSMKSLRAAASGEEPLFPSELEREAEPESGPQPGDAR
jgi:hypothetical protein